MDYLEYSLKEAGADHLMSATLKETLVEHAGGNLRMLNNMAAELLAKEAQDELTQMDEKLFLSTFAQGKSSSKRKKSQ